MKTDSIRKAARKLGIQESSAKSIYYRFKKTGCLEKQSKINKRYKTATLSHKSSESAVSETTQKEWNSSASKENIAND